MRYKREQDARGIERAAGRNGYGEVKYEVGEAGA